MSRIKLERWVNVDPFGDLSILHFTRGHADNSEAIKVAQRQGHNPPRIACIKVTIEYEEGEGLEQGLLVTGEKT